MKVEFVLPRVIVFLLVLAPAVFINEHFDLGWWSVVLGGYAAMTASALLVVVDQRINTVVDQSIEKDH